MVKFRIHVSGPAENDLRDIVRYISAQLAAPMTADKILDELNKAMTGLANMPQKCPLLHDERLASMGYRKLIVKSYVIFFTANGKTKTVNIERILYARRDWLHIL